MPRAVVGLMFGAGFGFVMAWAHLTDPAVIHQMLLLREPDVFLLMGAAIVVAAVGVRFLRATGARSLVTREAVSWTVAPPGTRHVAGSVVFGAGWSLAGTCPGPVAAMVGQGRLGGLIVIAGLAIGIVLQGALARQRKTAASQVETAATAAGL